MPHLRQQIREAVAAQVTGLTTTGARVRQSRMYPQTAADLPCLLVHSNDTEQIAPADQGTLQQRDLPIVIRGLAKGGATLDDTLDAIALEVETAMAANPWLSGKAHASRLTAIDVNFDDSTDKPVGEIQLSYLVTYFTQAGTPGTIA